MRILGVDPGSVVCGYGVVEKEGKNLTLIEYGVIEAKRQHDDMPMRLKTIYTRLQKVIERSLPDQLAIETIFYHKSASSIIKLAHARSAAILAAIMVDIPAAEYAPRFIKRAVTGNGNASKEQVQYMVRTLLNIEETPDFYDATDALAVAICHSYQIAALAGKSGKRNASSWKEFIELNPERVKSQK
jgi:crossover junction endodeoxyribonuclease RuvC